jgi:hypothetical protein
MARYTVKFLQLSTGYVAGSIPPRFDETYKKPIHACGSDATLHCDGRYSLQRIHKEALDYAKRRGFIGYQIVYKNDGYLPDRVASGQILLQGAQA